MNIDHLKKAAWKNRQDFPCCFFGYLSSNMDLLQESGIFGGIGHEHVPI